MGIDHLHPLGWSSKLGLLLFLTTWNSNNQSYRLHLQQRAPVVSLVINITIYLVGGWTTHLKNISQNGNRLQFSGWKQKKIETTTYLQGSIHRKWFFRISPSAVWQEWFLDDQRCENMACGVQNPPVVEGDSPVAVGRSKKSSLFCALHLEDSAQIGLANNGGPWWVGGRSLWSDMGTL